VLEQQLETITSVLKQTRAGMPETLTDDDVNNALMRLISLLKRTPGGISTNLAPAPRDTLDEFQKQSDRLRMGQRIVQEDPIMQTWSRALESVKEEASLMKFDERDGPVVGHAARAVGAASDAGCYAARSMKDLFQSSQARTKEMPVVFGFFFLAVAYSVPNWCVAFLLHCSGIFLVISGIKGALAESFQYIANTTSFVMERCFGAALEIPQDIHGTIQSSMNKLAQKLSCNINFDWRNKEQSGGLMGLVGSVVGLFTG